MDEECLWISIPKRKSLVSSYHLTRLHAGAKFSNRHYQFSGGLHGVGVSVVNALSKHLQVTVYRDKKIFEMYFKNGDKATELEITGKAELEHRHISTLWPGIGDLFLKIVNFWFRN